MTEVHESVQAATAKLHEGAPAPPARFILVLRPTDDPVVRRPTVIFDLDGATLSFEGKEVRFPEVARDALVAVTEAPEPFSAADLPALLDEAGRLVLVRRLVREGFLRCP